MPAAVGMIAITPLIAPLAGRIGARTAVGLGFGLAAAGFAAPAFVEHLALAKALSREVRGGQAMTRTIFSRYENSFSRERHQ